MNLKFNALVDEECPICGEYLSFNDDLYITEFFDIVGCSNCVKIKNAYEFLEGD